MSMSDWVQLCMAAGINVRNIGPMDVYMVSGKIINDSALTAASIGQGISRVQALKAMSSAERVALRERVTGVVPFPGSAK
jgi:hypothetical protein